MDFHVFDLYSHRNFCLILTEFLRPALVSNIRILKIKEEKWQIPGGRGSWDPPAGPGSCSRSTGCSSRAGTYRAAKSAAHRIESGTLLFGFDGSGISFKKTIGYIWS